VAAAEALGSFNAKMRGPNHGGYRKLRAKMVKNGEGQFANSLPFVAKLQ
jgi:hypothetical protein